MLSYHINITSFYLFPIVPFANMRKTSLSHEDRGSMEAIQDGTYFNAPRGTSLTISLTHFDSRRISDTSGDPRRAWSVERLVSH